MASKRYLELLEEAKDLHIRKNAGYSGADNPDPWANFRMAEDFGVSAFKGCLVRMSDKYIRVKNLVKNPNNEQVGENIKDTLRDLAAYALIAVCLLEEEQGAEELEDVIPFSGTDLLPKETLQRLGILIDESFASTSYPKRVENVRPLTD